jgi:exonuclease VII large subunit
VSHPLEQEIHAWLRSARRHFDELEVAYVAQRRAARRLAQAKESLEDLSAALYRDGAIQGKNKEERDASLRLLTAQRRLEITESEDALDTATIRLEQARSGVGRDRQERHALQMRVALLSHPDPLQPDAQANTERHAPPPAKITPLEVLPLFDLERVG